MGKSVFEKLHSTSTDAILANPFEKIIVVHILITTLFKYPTSGKIHRSILWFPIVPGSPSEMYIIYSTYSETNN